MRLGTFAPPTLNDPHESALEYQKVQLKKSGKWIQPIQWDLIEKRTLLCDICSLPISCCPALDAMCSLCNVVAHISCLSDNQRNMSYRNSWICQYCADDIKISKDIFITYKMKLNHEVLLFSFSNFHLILIGSKEYVSNFDCKSLEKISMS